MESKETARADGAREWRNADGKLHREDGPAVVKPDGTQEWWRNGKRTASMGRMVEIVDQLTNRPAETTPEQMRQAAEIIMALSRRLSEAETESLRLLGELQEENAGLRARLETAKGRLQNTRDSALAFWPRPSSVISGLDDIVAALDGTI